MRYPKLRELREAVKALIKGPYTSKFPAVPHVPMPRFRGKPVPNNDECIGCGACAEVCPSGAIEMINDITSDEKSPVRRLIWHYDDCNFCAQCERLCTTEKGVKLSNTEYDLACFDRHVLVSEIKKELVLCENCGNMIGTKEQIMWIIKKLGPKAYGNISGLFYLQNELNLIEEISQGKASPTLKRSDLFRILCPKCRHLVLVFDEFNK